MSVEEVKTFVMKHVFTDVMNMELHAYHSGPREYHFGVPWCFVLYRDETDFDINLDCFRGTKSSEDWSINTTINTKIFKWGNGETIENRRVFAMEDFRSAEYLKTHVPLIDYLVDGNFTVECKVTIHEMTGIEDPMEKRIFKSFDDESAREFSDVVLVVNDQKFYMNKMYLSHHSTYFKSLLCGSFNESEKSEVELKDIEPKDFQKFLEVLYGEPAIDDDNIEGILKLADMYDAKTVIRQCEHFYLCLSEQDLVSKFTTALKYNMNQLKKKCISEIKSVEDIKEVIAENDGRIDHPTTKKLLKMSIDFYEKK